MSDSGTRAQDKVDTALLGHRDTAAAFVEDANASADRSRALLDERARVLARPPIPPRQAGESIELVTFRLAKDHYGLEASHVREIVRLVDPTPVPGAPDFLVGVVNLRGDLLPIVDIRKFLGLPMRGVTDLSRLIVLGVDRAEFGILADVADEFVTLRASEILESPLVGGIGREYVRGITTQALIVLDARVLLRDERLFLRDSEATRDDVAVGEGAR
jgi:purine-binding chemotaxis protein CheW